MGTARNDSGLFSSSPSPRLSFSFVSPSPPLALSFECVFQTCRHDIKKNLADQHFDDTANAFGVDSSEERKFLGTSITYGSAASGVGIIGRFLRVKGVMFCLMGGEFFFMRSCVPILFVAS